MSKALKRRESRRTLTIPIVLAAAIGLTGLLLLRNSQAAGFTITSEAESGQTAGVAAVVDFTGASASKAVRFGAPTSNPGPNPVPPGYTPPANPKLSQEGRNVLYFLQSLEGKNILAGQEEADRCTTCEMDHMRAITGKIPALHGHDVADYIIDPIQESINDWNIRRQIVTFSWHVGAPPSDDSNFDNTFKNVDVNRVLQPGTNENNVYMAKLNKMAGRLQRLEDAKVPVVWRPFHEMTGGWFWWSKSGADTYKRLWIHMYDYFTFTKGLDNLLWSWSVAQTKAPDAAWYPGDRYVDLTGSDMYKGFNGIDAVGSHYTKHKSIAPAKPAALTETDIIPDPQQLIDRRIHLIWFLPWFGQYVDLNSSSYKSRVYNHPYVITADEMPDLKQPFPNP